MYTTAVSSVVRPQQHGGIFDPETQQWSAVNNSSAARECAEASGEEGAEDKRPRDGDGDGDGDAASVEEPALKKIKVRGGVPTCAAILLLCIFVATLLDISPRPSFQTHQRVWLEHLNLFYTSFLLSNYIPI